MLETHFFIEVLSEKLKKVLPSLISLQQTADVKNRYICKSGRLISDIIKIANITKTEGFLITIRH